MSILVLFGFLALLQHGGFPGEWRLGVDAYSCEHGGSACASPSRTGNLDYAEIPRDNGAAPFGFVKYDNAFEQFAHPSTRESSTPSSTINLPSEELEDDGPPPHKRQRTDECNSTNVETPPKEKYDEKSCLKEDTRHDETLDLIARRLSVRPITKEFFDSLKVQQKLMERLKELSEKERRYEDDLEIADLVYLLKLVGPLNPKLETFGERAGKGAMLLLEGDRLLTAGRDLLRSAITCISTSTE